MWTGATDTAAAPAAPRNGCRSVRQWCGSGRQLLAMKRLARAATATTAAVFREETVAAETTRAATATGVATADVSQSLEFLPWPGSGSIVSRAFFANSPRWPSYGPARRSGAVGPLRLHRVVRRSGLRPSPRTRKIVEGWVRGRHTC